MVVDLFILSLLPFLVVLVLGYIFESIVRGKDLGAFTSIISILMFIGVVFHELSHYIFCVLTRVPTEGLHISLRYKGHINPHGEVVPEHPYKITFLQAMLVSLGPVLVGTWIAYFSLNAAFNPALDPLVRIIAGLVVVSTLLASTPSPADFHMIKFAFSNDPQHSYYQLSLISLSLLLSWGIVNLFNLVFSFEPLYYIIIILWYFFLKFSFIGIRWGISRLSARFGSDQDQSSFKRFSRKTYRSLKFK